jgi:hypothetical protein
MSDDNANKAEQYRRMVERQQGVVRAPNPPPPSPPAPQPPNPTPASKPNPNQKGQ